MFYIIESEDNLNRLLEKDSNVFVDLIEQSDRYHPAVNTPIAVYVRPLSDEKGYIVPINHHDCLNIDIGVVKNFIGKLNTLYVINKKKFLHYFFHRNIIDLQMLRLSHGKEKINTEGSNSTKDWFDKKYFNDRDLNSIVPISIHCEIKNNLYNLIREDLLLEKNSSFEFLNHTFTNVFFLLEKQGIHTNSNVFTNFYKLENPQFNHKQNEVFGVYNLFNTTTRPTNSFNNVNLTAIPHKEEIRKNIIPKNDEFVEFDFDGYHLRLLADLVDFPLTPDSAHKQFAKYYLGKTEFTEEEYSLIKQQNFQIIYGKIPKEFLNYELFQRIDNFINLLWEDYVDKGKIELPISNKPLLYRDDMHPQKLMNYYLQAYETGCNTLVLKDVLNLLKNKKSFLTLYTYDSILLDFNKNEGEHLLKEISSILNRNNKFPVHYRSGPDLGF